MVIHAGDVEPSEASWDIPEPPASQASQVPLDSAARAEPFALAEDLPARVPEEATLPLVIPPPGGIPREALAATEKPNSALPANPQLRRNIVAIVAAFGLVGVVAVTMLGHRRDALPQLDPSAARVDQVPPKVSAAVPGQAPTLAETPSAKPNAVEPTPPVAASAAPAPPVATSTALAAPAALLPNTTRVTLELKPADAKVINHGVAVPGPPFVFDVPKGKRIVVEAGRLGFVTRKVTIDDRKPVISIGLLRAPAPKQQR